jgi:hypothetical protein
MAITSHGGPRVCFTMPMRRAKGNFPLRRLVYRESRILHPTGTNWSATSTRRVPSRRTAGQSQGPVLLCPCVGRECGRRYLTCYRLVTYSVGIRRFPFFHMVPYRIISIIDHSLETTVSAKKSVRQMDVYGNALACAMNVPGGIHMIMVSAWCCIEDGH